MRITKYYPKNAGDVVFFGRILNNIPLHPREVTLFICKESFDSNTFCCVLMGTLEGKIVGISCELYSCQTLKPGECYLGTLTPKMDFVNWQEVHPYVDMLNIQPCHLN